MTWSHDHGWHYHVHVGIPCQAGADGARELGEWFLSRYLSYIRAAGFEALRKGQDVTLPVNRDRAADYLAKGVTTSRDATWELAGMALKRGKGKVDAGMHPFDILEAASGDAKMAALWREYASVMPGTRSCIVTRSMADKLGLDDFTDEDQPGVQPQDDDGLAGHLPAYIWSDLMKRRKASTVLSALEDGGLEAWPEVLALAYHLAGATPPATAEAPPAVTVREHAPSAEDVAREALSRRFFHRGRAGNAIRDALDRHRGEAVARGLVFVPPDMGQVMQRMAA